MLSLVGIHYDSMGNITYRHVTLYGQLTIPLFHMADVILSCLDYGGLHYVLTSPRITLFWHFLTLMWMLDGQLYTMLTILWLYYSLALCDMDRPFLYVNGSSLLWWCPPYIM